MTNCGSWNGKWTGSGKKYVRVRKYKKVKGQEIMTDATETLDCIRDGGIFGHNPVRYVPTGRFSKSWRYDWKDGWGCNVIAEIVDSKTANKLRKESDGFCNYDWMIDSIEKIDKILNSIGE